MNIQDIMKVWEIESCYSMESEFWFKKLSIALKIHQDLNSNDSELLCHAVLDKLT